METYLCRQCGKRLDASTKVCPDCGSLNPHNLEVIAEVTEQQKSTEKAVKKFSNGMFTATLIAGLLFCIVHIVLLVSDPPSFLTAELFIGAVCGAMAAYFSVIGMTKKEGSMNAALITAGISFLLLIMSVWILA